LIGPLVALRAVGGLAETCGKYLDLGFVPDLFEIICSSFVLTVKRVLTWPTVPDRQLMLDFGRERR
jgi:hypothetical protein